MDLPPTPDEADALYSEVLPSKAADPSTFANIAYSSRIETVTETGNKDKGKSKCVLILLATLVAVTLIVAGISITMAAISLFSKSISTEINTLRDEVQLVVNDLQQNLSAREAEIMQLRADIARLR